MPLVKMQGLQGVASPCVRQVFSSAPRAARGSVRLQRTSARPLRFRRGSGVACTAAATREHSAKSTKTFDALAAEFGALPEGPDRYKLLLKYAASLPPLPNAERTLDSRVMGCTSQTWITVAVDKSTGAAVVSGAFEQRSSAMPSCHVLEVPTRRDL